MPLPYRARAIPTALTLSLLLTSCFPISPGDTDDKSDDGAVAGDLSVIFTSSANTTTLLRYAQLDFHAESAVTYHCSLDGEAATDCQPPVFIPSLAEGTHQFSVQAEDDSGTFGAATVVSWQVDELLVTGHDDLVNVNLVPGRVADASWRGIFRINCDFSHSSYNDPIVFPGEENAAHLHRFYGNTATDHQTTVASLYTRGESSCQGNQLNLSSYWVPALLAPLYNARTAEREVDALGDPAWQVVPAVVGADDVAHEVFYYSAGVADLTSIQPIPAGLRMIAGDSNTLPGEVQDTSVASWHCQSWVSNDASSTQLSATIPECKEPDRVRLDLFFPSCWNGVDLDSSDHRSHMAYPVTSGGANSVHCPDSHPVPVVRVSYHYAFGVKPEASDPATRTSRGWRLASDQYTVSDSTPGGLSIHGDWFNGWHPSVMEMILQDCIQGGLDCHDGNLANGYRLSGTQAGAQTEPEIFNAGMGIGSAM